MIRSLLTFFLVGLVTIMVTGTALAVAGVLLGIAGHLAAFLLFKVGPVLLVGWLALKLFAKVRGRDSLTASDRRWLDSR